MNSDKWIEEDITIVKKKFNKCVANNDDELASYVLAMGRLLNSIASMQNANIYRHERRILFASLPVFMRFFFEQIDNALAEEIIEKKIKLNLDINDSVQRIMTVYRNVIGSMMNADSQISSSNFAIDTNLYQLSPKITSFYSDLLTYTVSLYRVEDDKENSNYSFLLYPSLESLTQSYKLFKYRNEKGSFVIVYLSECLMESVETVPIMLLHEAFHFLGRDERHRKKRAMALQELITDYLLERLMIGIPEEYITEVEKVLTNYLENKIYDIKREIKRLDEDDKFLYGHKIEKIIKQLYEDILFQMLQHDFIEDLLESLDYSELEYEVQLADFEIINRCDKAIKNNISEILNMHVIGKASGIFMEMFREVYADIIMILLSKISAEQYMQVFEASILINKDSERVDIDRLLRQLYVSNVVAKCFSKDTDDGGDLVNGWNECCEKSQSDLEEGEEQGEGQGNEGDGNNMEDSPDLYIEQAKRYIDIQDTKLYITHSIYRDKIFNKYFEICATDAYCKINKMDSEALQTFRKNFKVLVSGDKGKLLMCMYSGARFNNISERYKYAIENVR